ncbi:Vesicle transport protein [Caenorhabditis elegans]|uniref:Vesicle transport protein n=2 Tax=Caenorhabditis elegans TaxID=6239 RepID=G5EDD5_CAEEL|nr:Vesicle transport protein [Caenorhabditis elegans]CAA93859.1 Vesicle transport protein [Caenorhabditis elegans]|eukprot:NP_495905.1 Vesicle transport protein [Caenorhabditis elegans]
MSALEQFINDQKKKGSGISSSASFSSFDSLRNKLPTSIGGFSLLSRSETTDSQQLLVGDDSGDGQLPASRNRKSSGWFSPSTQDESMFGMTRTQRIIAFFMCIIGAIFCFSTAAVLIPVILVSTRKFAGLNTLGSLLLLLSFAFLLGPKSYLTHMASPQRRLVTVSYLSALFATLYSSLWLKSTIFTLIAAIFQGFTLVWYVLSYVPGGERGLFFMTSLFTSFLRRSTTSTVLPI